MRSRKVQSTRVPRGIPLWALLPLLLAGLLLSSQCGNFLFYPTLDGKEGPLAISPASATLAPRAGYTFTASGGLPPYAYSLNGSGEIDPQTGSYTAPGTQTQDFITVTDSSGTSRTATVEVLPPGPLSISPVSAAVETGGSITFSASGGVPPYTFTMASGGGSVGAGSGVYTAPGTAGTAAVMVTDAADASCEAAVAITETPSSQLLVISPSSTTVVAGGGCTFAASGGSAPYVFSLVSSSAATPGSVTPGGSYTAGTIGTEVVRVTDAALLTSDATVTVVSGGPLAISPTSVIVPVNGQETFAAAGGTPPYTYSVFAGGVGSINAATGLYSAPPDPGSATVRVTDAALATAEAFATIAGSGCGLSFTESEPNEDKSPPFTHTNDFGIRLVPGCRTLITGATDADKKPDVFRFDTGSATEILFIARWNSGDNEIDFNIYHTSGDKIGSGKSPDPDLEAYFWLVDSPGAVRYIELEIKDRGNIPYTLEIRGF